MTLAPRPVLTLAVGVTGHRWIKLAGPARAFIRPRLEAAFAEIDAALADEFGRAKGLFAANPRDGAPPFRVRLLSGFAPGADLIAAELAPPDWDVEAILPMPLGQYEKTFAHDPDAPADPIEAFRETLKRAQAGVETRIVELPAIDATSAEGAAPTPAAQNRADDAAYERLGEWMGRQIDLLVAVWDGEDTRLRGGASEVISRALDDGIPVLWLSATEDRAPRLMTRRDEMAAKVHTADALAGPLQNAIAHAVRPPAENEKVEDPDERPARRRLDDFLTRPTPTRCWWFPYDGLKRLAHLQRPRLRLPINTLAQETQAWQDFLDRAPEGRGLRERIETILLPRFLAADVIATYFAHAYRSVYVAAYGLAMSAVAVPVIGEVAIGDRDGDTALRVEAALAGLELIIIVVIFWLITAGRGGFFHERWMDTRALAEPLRHARFLALIGETDIWRDLRLATSQGSAWTSWYLRATVRELGLPFGTLDADYQNAALTATREAELRPQLDFHDDNHERLNHLHHVLHRAGDWSFIATGAALVAYLCGFIYHWAGVYFSVGSPAALNVCETFLQGSLKPLTLITALLPAFGAAASGIRFTGDFEGFAKRSRQTAEALERLKEDYERAEADVDFRATSEVLSETARAMTEDLSGWRSIYALKRLNLPA